MPKLILVAERVNAGGRAVSDRWGTVYHDPERYWQLMCRHKAFVWYDTPAGRAAQDRCWDQLGRVTGGPPIDYQLNLLRPDPRAGAWSLDEARKGATCLLAACPKPALVVACGTRVCKAVSKLLPGQPYPLLPGVIVGDGPVWLTRIPHPSGRNPQWNDEAFIRSVRERFEANYSELMCEEAV